MLSRFRNCGAPLQGQIAAWEERIREQPSVAKWTALAVTTRLSYPVSPEDLDIYR